MKKCNAYYRRKSLLQSDEIVFPLQSEILQRHKYNLTNVLNEYIGKPIQLDIGLEPPLNGSKDDLWVSPSDLLIPHVRLKPPLTNKYVKAITHVGILEIGREIQEKYQNEILDRFDVEMRLLADKLNFMCKKEISNAIFQEKLRGEQQLKMEIRRIEHECKTQREEEINKLRSNLLMEQQQKLEKQKETLVEEAKQRAKDAVNEAANSLLKKFQYKFELQEQKHTKDLAQAIRIEEEKITKALKNANADKLEALRILRHDLECRNMANLMYILTAERNRCENERQKIYDEYKILIDEMTLNALDLYQNILGLKSSCNNLKSKLYKYHSFIEQILCEFQYFINYTFKSTPSQCEYLLNLHQFVRHHVQKDLSSLSKNISTKHSKESIHKLAPSILKLTRKVDKDWFLPSRFQNKMNTPNGTDNNFAIHTLDEDSPIPSQQTLSSKNELTHLLYNKYLYVREDFRNRNSKDFPNNGHNIWLDASDNSSETGDEISLGTKIYPTSSTVHFHLKPVDEYEKTELSHNNSMQNVEGQQTIKNPSRVSDNSVRIDVKQHQNQCIEVSQNNKEKRIASPRGSILRRSSLKSSKKSVIGIITTAMNRKPSCTIKEKTDEDLTSMDIPLKLSAVEMISGHTNKHSSKIAVAKNSFVIHQLRKYSETVQHDLNESDEVTSEINENQNNSSVTKPLKIPSVVSILIAPKKGDEAVSKLTLVRDSVELIREKSTVRSKSGVTSPTAVPITASSIIFKLPPNDEVKRYRSSTSSKNIDDMGLKKTSPPKTRQLQKAIDKEEIPIETVASRLTLATDSIELLKQKSDATAHKSATKAKSKRIKEDKSLVLITQSVVTADDQQSVENSSFIDDTKYKYQDIVKNWSNANQIKSNNGRRSSLSKSKTSRVTIIGEPVNVIHRDSIRNFRANNHLIDFDTMNPFSLNHLDVIDKQDPYDSNKYYYPLQLQP